MPRVFVGSFLWLIVACYAAVAEERRPAIVLDLNGTVGPAVSDYIRGGLQTAQKQNAVVVILRMDTPGGLDTTMREIVRDILSSTIPVATYVAPSGARAASAGTFILYASHIAAMAPGTNLGAATPVQLGGVPQPSPSKEPGVSKTNKNDNDKGPKSGSPSTMRPHPSLEDKAVNDASAYIRSLALMRGRNAKWAEQAVRAAASLPAKEALAAGVIDLLADNVEDLLNKLDGRHVIVLDHDQQLDTRAAPIISIEPDWRTKLLAIITDPNVAYVLLLIGMFGLTFELSHPGIALPGVAGAICLIVALYAFHLMPVNYAGLGLVLLGIALMAAEAFFPTLGALGIGGVIAFGLGSVFLFQSDSGGFALSLKVIIAVTVVSATFFLIILSMAVKAHRRPVVSGQEQLVGSDAQVIEWHHGEGRVLAHGERWKAVATTPLEAGQEVRVTSIQGLTLRVEPLKKGRDHDGAA